MTTLLENCRFSDVVGYTKGGHPIRPCGHCGKAVAMPSGSTSGKARVRHKCPHGRWCDRGNPLLHLNNHPGCKQCAEEQKKKGDL